MVEIVGIIASLFVLFSFLMKDVKKIRFINIIGDVLFVTYGILIHSFSTWFLNGALILIQIYYLTRKKD